MIEVIKFLNLTQEFNKRIIIKDFNYIFYSGKNYFLFGDNAKGKTIIFYLLLGRIRPTSGNIFVCGDDIFKFKEKELLLYRRQLGLVWQNFFLIEEKNVFENIALPLALNGEKSDLIRNKVFMFLKEVGLFHRCYKFPKDLSLGEKQIICILRGLINSPKIILFDEAFNNLSLELAKNIWIFINKYKDNNAVILFMTKKNSIIENFNGEIVKL